MPKKAVAAPKRRALNMKTTAAVRERLEQAALESGRSLTHEVEYRLERSFEIEERNKVEALLTGGEGTARLMRAVGAMVQFVELRSGRSVSEHGPTRMAARAAIHEIADLYLSSADDGELCNDETPEGQESSRLIGAALLLVHYVSGRIDIDRLHSSIE